MLLLVTSIGARGKNGFTKDYLQKQREKRNTKDTVQVNSCNYKQMQMHLIQSM